MNKAELRAIALIVKKLGWNDMPASIALDAIQRMVSNDLAVTLDCCGWEDEPEDACNAWDIPSKEWEWEHYQDYLAEMQEAYDETIYSLMYSFN